MHARTIAGRRQTRTRQGQRARGRVRAGHRRHRGDVRRRRLAPTPPRSPGSSRPWWTVRTSPRASGSPPGGGSDDITAVRRLGNRFLQLDERCFRHPVLRPLLRLQRVLGRPDPAARPARPRRGQPPEARRCSGATASRSRPSSTAGSPRPALTIAEVPSVERDRLHGESNLRTFRDGFRVLRTIVVEWLKRDARVRRPSSQASRHRGQRRAVPGPRSRRRTARNA